MSANLGSVLGTSARLLRLLSLLQAHHDWTGPALAERLGVSTRTVRTDIERLRSLGYPVHATPGVTGGYRLGPGAALPPLLLDDEEAVAVAVGLRTAAGGSVSGIEETSVRALAKLEQVLPSRLRHRVAALQAATVTVPAAGPEVDPDVLTAVAGAIRASERLRIDYVTHAGTEVRRVTEPHRLVSWGRRWYLVAWDVEKADWRTFRVDRLTPRSPTGPRFRPRELPDDVTSFVQRGVGAATWRFFGRIRLHAGADQVRDRLPPAVSLVSEGHGTCTVEVGSDSAHMLALYIGLLDVDFEVLHPPELANAVARLGRRYAAAGGRRRKSPSARETPHETASPSSARRRRRR